MSDSLASLRRKLNGAEQLGAVVRAMKAIAASSIGQYEKAVDALGQYQRSVELGLSLCLRGKRGIAAAPTPATTADRPIGALVFGSDQGLVGRFNEVIGNFARETLRQLPGPKTVWAVGERVCSSLEEDGLHVTKQFAVPSSVAAITALVAEMQLEIEGYTAGERYSEVHVFHNSPQAAARYEATHQRLLPLDAAWHNRLTQIPWPNAQLAEVLGGERREPDSPDTRAIVHFALQDVCGIPGKREPQPVGSHAARGKEYRERLGRSAALTQSPAAELDRRGALRRGGGIQRAHLNAAQATSDGSESGKSRRATPIQSSAIP